MSARIGYGRHAILSSSISLRDAVEMMKKHLNLEKVRLAYPDGKKIGKYSQLTNLNKL